MKKISLQPLKGAGTPSYSRRSSVEGEKRVCGMAGQSPHCGRGWGHVRTRFHRTGRFHPDNEQDPLFYFSFLSK